VLDWEWEWGTRSCLVLLLNCGTGASLVAGVWIEAGDNRWSKCLC
jgi:hypothetical protein